MTTRMFYYIMFLKLKNISISLHLSLYSGMVTIVLQCNTISLLSGIAISITIFIVFLGEVSEILN